MLGTLPAKPKSPPTSGRLLGVTEGVCVLIAWVSLHLWPIFRIGLSGSGQETQASWTPVVASGPRGWGSFLWLPEVVGSPHGIQTLG